MVTLFTPLDVRYLYGNINNPFEGININNDLSDPLNNLNDNISDTFNDIDSNFIDDISGFLDDLGSGVDDFIDDVFDELSANGTDNNLILGVVGVDNLTGSAGDDIIIGLSGRDVLAGRGGDDALWGDRGRDILYGGEGYDIFGLQLKLGVDTIMDFVDGQDRLTLPDNLSFGNLTITQEGSRTVVAYADSRLAVLEGVQANQIAIDDFISI